MFKSLIIFLFPATFSANYTFHTVSYVRNFDGDTVTVTIPTVHPLLGHEISIRVNGIDTPEIRGKTQCEKDKAIEAREVVRKLLTQTRKITLKNATRGKYFRIVADVYAGKTNVAKILLDKGLAVPYDGGSKKDIEWRCD